MQGQSINQEDAWAIIRAYFDQHGLVSQQISSFERFIDYTIQDILKDQSKIEIEREH